jgi:hypothetical protein
MFYYLKNRTSKSITLKSLDVTIKPNGVIRIKKVDFLKKYGSFKKDPLAIKVKLVNVAQYVKMNQKTSAPKKRRTVTNKSKTTNNTTKNNKQEDKSVTKKNEENKTTNNTTKKNEK